MTIATLRPRYIIGSSRDRWSSSFRAANSHWREVLHWLVRTVAGAPHCYWSLVSPAAVRRLSAPRDRLGAAETGRSAGRDALLAAVPQYRASTPVIAVRIKRTLAALTRFWTLYY